MISAHEARQNASNVVDNAYTTNVFKHAIERLEERIKEASSQGKHEICYNVSMFDICKFSSLEKDERATEADRVAIKTFMEEHGFTFFYYSMGSANHTWFTCEW